MPYEDNNIVGETARAVTFSGLVLGKWAEIMDLSEQFRANYILGSADLDLTAKYLSKLTRLYAALEPKVKGRTDLKDFKVAFEKYKPYCYDPRQLNTPENAKDIFGLEACLEDILDHLAITKF